MNEVTNISDVITDSINQLTTQASNWVPKLIGAIIVLTIGYILARIVKTIASKSLGYGKIGELLNNKEITTNLKKVGVSASIPGVVASVLYWLVFLVFITSAADMLGLTIVGEAIEGLFAYIPRIVSAIIVLVIALQVAKIVNKAIAASLSSMQFNFAGVFASVASSLITFFGFIMAATQLGFETEIITTNFSIIVAGFAAALAIGIGFGSKNAVANIISGYQAKDLYKVGQTITIGGENMKIKKVTNSAIVVEHKGGESVIAFSHLMS